MAARNSKFVYTSSNNNAITVYYRVPNHEGIGIIVFIIVGIVVAIIIVSAISVAIRKKRARQNTNNYERFNDGQHSGPIHNPNNGSTYSTSTNNPNYNYNAGNQGWNNNTGNQGWNNNTGKQGWNNNAGNQGWNNNGSNNQNPYGNVSN
jgi:type II secretory pathway pseudopilin PulG